MKRIQNNYAFNRNFIAVKKMPAINFKKFHTKEPGQSL